MVDQYEATLESDKVLEHHRRQLDPSENPATLNGTVTLEAVAAQVLLIIEGMELVPSENPATLNGTVTLEAVAAQVLLIIEGMELVPSENPATLTGQ
jgi:hypothetical protein